MHNTTAILALTITTALGLATAGLSTPNVHAADAAKEKCFGVVKAGKNDCAANGHACAGQAKTDNNPKEWVYVPTGTCERLVGGRQS